MGKRFVFPAIVAALTLSGCDGAITGTDQQRREAMVQRCIAQASALPTECAQAAEVTIPRPNR